MSYEDDAQQQNARSRGLCGAIVKNGTRVCILPPNHRPGHDEDDSDALRRRIAHLEAGILTAERHLMAYARENALDDLHELLPEKFPRRRLSSS